MKSQTSLNIRVTGIFMLVALIFSTTFFFSSCNKEEKEATLNFHLTDAPGNFDEVNIDIQSIEIRVDSSVMTWNLFNPGVYNLLDLVNGLDTLLVSGNVQAGNLHQIRLILGSNNSVMVDSMTYPLQTPSAQQSGLKLNVHYNIEAGVTYDFTLDFDAAHSIVKTGNGKYILKPVIKVFTDAVSGAISGLTYPALSAYSVEAISGTDTFGSAPDTNGYFLIPGVPQGTYDVTVYGNTPYADTTITGINVVNGVVYDLDTIFM